MPSHRPGTYRGYRAAGIRLREERSADLPLRRVDRFDAIVDAVHAFDKAHVVMLCETSIVDHETAQAIFRGIRHMEEVGMRRARLDAHGGEHSLEYFVTREYGEDVGGWINTARSSGDLAEVSRRLAIRDRIIASAECLVALRRTAVALAGRHADVVFPAQTFLQYAQPTSLGHWFDMWAEVFARQTQRLLALHARVNESPAGAGILSGSDFSVDRFRVAELLGFDRPMVNTFDAIMSHDVTLESQSVLAMVWNDLARLSDDVEQWLASDTGFISVPDRFCDTSSVMPQKRNPMLPQKIKSQAAKALGMLSSGYLAERGASGQTMLERNEPEVLMWELFDALPRMVHDLTQLLEALIPQRERMLQAASGWSTASELASLIVRKTGLSWRTAHQIIGITVRLAEDRHIEAGGVTSQLIDEAALEYVGHALNLSMSDVVDALDPVSFVRRRTLFGGAAAPALAAAIRIQSDAIEADEANIAMRSQQAEDASQSLEDVIDAILKGECGQTRGGR